MPVGTADGSVRLHVSDVDNSELVVVVRLAGDALTWDSYSRKNSTLLQRAAWASELREVAAWLESRP